MSKTKYLFLHIEKTAGTTLVNYLKDIGKNFKYTHPTEVTSEFVSSTLPKLDIVAGHLKHDLVSNYMQEFYKITFLRDPIDRVLSFYYYAKEIPRTADPITQKSKDLSIIDFFQFCKESNDRRFVNGMTFKLTDYYGQNELKNSMENLKNMDFIGLQEFFSESMMMLSYLNGWNPLEDIPMTNKTKNRSKASELSDEIIESIIDINQDDIKLYSFAKELYQEQKSRVLYRAIKECYGVKI